jgi:hypothetical protein
MRLLPVISSTSPQNGRGGIIEYKAKKAATRTREGQQTFMAAIFTLQAGKAVVAANAILV